MKIKKYIFVLIGCLIFFSILTFQIFPIIMNLQSFQWDFKVCYYSSKAHLAGYNPYSIKAVYHFSSGRVTMPFLYPPYTLCIYQIIAKMDFFKAYYIFLTIKVFMYLLLVLLWRKAFFKETNIIMFLLFISLSIFSEASYLDFRAGNVTVIEQLFFWTGILLLFKKKILLSGLFIIFSSLFKFLNIPFLLVFLEKRLIKYFFIFLFILVMILLTTWYIFPFESNEFLKNIFYYYKDWFIYEHPGRHCSVSTLNFFRAVSFGDPVVLFVLTVVFILSVSIFVILTNYKLLRTQHLLIYFLIVVYNLTMPRVKDYSLINLLPPAYFLLDYFSKRKNIFFVIVLILLFFILSPHPFYPMVIKNMENFNLVSPILKVLPFRFREIIQDYHILLTCYILWMIYIFVIFKERRMLTGKGVT